MLSFFNKWSFTLSNLSFFLRQLSSPYVIAVFKKVLGTINFVRRVQFFAAELIQFWYRLLSTHFFMSEEQNFKFCHFSLLNSYIFLRLTLAPIWIFCQTGEAGRRHQACWTSAPRSCPSCRRRWWTRASRWPPQQTSGLNSSQPVKKRLTYWSSLTIIL